MVRVSRRYTELCILNVVCHETFISKVRIY